jgi:adenylylsulfate kinase-like enzyme
MRSGMNKGLGFSPEDRKENIRRTAETAVLMADAGFIVLCSLVSPYIEDRRNARKIVEEKQMKFYEIFVNTPLEECINRDTKGLYRRAISGQIAGMYLIQI